MSITERHWFTCITWPVVIDIKPSTSCTKISMYSTLSLKWEFNLWSTKISVSSPNWIQQVLWRQITPDTSCRWGRYLSINRLQSQRADIHQHHLCAVSQTVPVKARVTFLCFIVWGSTYRCFSANLIPPHVLKWLELRFAWQSLALDREQTISEWIG